MKILLYDLSTRKEYFRHQQSQVICFKALVEFILTQLKQQAGKIRLTHFRKTRA